MIHAQQFLLLLDCPPTATSYPTQGHRELPERLLGKLMNIIIPKLHVNTQLFKSNQTIIKATPYVIITGITNTSKMCDFSLFEKGFGQIYGVLQSESVRYNSNS